MSAFLAVAGVSHLVAPCSYDHIVPGWTPGPARGWTIGSGLVELGLAASIANPRTRYRAAWATAVFFVLVFPANIKMATDAGFGFSVRQLGAWLRLPVQIPLVVWAVRVAKRDREPMPSEDFTESSLV